MITLKQTHKYLCLCVAAVYFIFACVYVVYCPPKVHGSAATYASAKTDARNQASVSAVGKVLPKLKFIIRPRVIFDKRAAATAISAILLFSIIVLALLQSIIHWRTALQLKPAPILSPDRKTLFRTWQI